MATWRHIGAGVVVSAGVMIGTLTYKYVTGQAMAELAGAAWERSVVARLHGTDAPDLWYDSVVTTNRVTNYTATVTLEYVSGTAKCDISPISFQFSSENWSVAQSVSITRKIPAVYGSGGTYAVKYNGVVEGNVYIDAADGAGGSLVFGSFIGDNVSWTPLSVVVGGIEPVLASVVLLQAPTSGTMTVSTSRVVTAVSGMAAITPFARNDQMQFFMDMLRYSVQGDPVDAGITPSWWLGQGATIESLAGDAGFASYATPTFSATTNRWEDVAGNSLYPTGGLVWARVVDGPVTSAPPKFFTLNSFCFYTNGLRYYPSLFGWNNRARTDTLGRVTLMPSSVFPYDVLYPYPYGGGVELNSSDDLAFVSTNGFPYANGSWWVSSGMHSNTLWQIQGNEWVNTNGEVRRASWIASNDFIKCAIMAAAMSNNVSICRILSDTGTVMRSVEMYDEPELDADITETNALPTASIHGWQYSRWVLASSGSNKETLETKAEGAGYVTTRYRYNQNLKPPAWVVTDTVSYVDSVYTNDLSVRSQYASRIRITGAYVDYPSAYAITNGYVSRVQIFAVYEAFRGATTPYATDVAGMHTENWRNTNWTTHIGSICDTTGLSPSEGSVSDATDVTVTNSLMWPVTDDSSDFFALGVYPQIYNAPPDLSSNAAPRTIGRLDSASGESSGISTVRVTLVTSVLNPTEYPIRFSLGPESISLPAHEDADYYGEVIDESERTFTDVISVPRDEYMNCDYGAFATKDDGMITYTSTYRRWEHNRRIECLPRVIVVVDWNFKHMNPANPYTPESFIPAWLTPAP